nr:MAG TPA: hypothetical protein [Caudoviricetes sp.]
MVFNEEFRIKFTKLTEKILRDTEYSEIVRGYKICKSKSEELMRKSETSKIESSAKIAV